MGVLFDGASLDTVLPNPYTNTLPLSGRYISLAEGTFVYSSFQGLVLHKFVDVSPWPELPVLSV